MAELKNQTFDIPPLRPKPEIAAVEPRVDLTIDSTQDENETLKLKIKEVEGRDPRTATPVVTILDNNIRATNPWESLI